MCDVSKVVYTYQYESEIEKEEKFPIGPILTHLSVVTELMSGSLYSLLHSLSSSPPPPLSRRLCYALDACLGMAYLHRPNNIILHRDLKALNLLVGGEGEGERKREREREFQRRISLLDVFPHLLSTDRSTTMGLLKWPILVSLACTYHRETMRNS